MQRGFRPMFREPVSMEDYQNRTEKAYPKEKMEKYRTVQSMVIGAEGWDLYRDISNIVGPDIRPVNEILEDLEKNQHKIVKVQEYQTQKGGEHYIRTGIEKKIYTGNWKYYDRKYAEEKGIREVKCRHHLCPKTFTTDEDMKKHFDRTHRGFIAY
jgi:hypothetical protein